MTSREIILANIEHTGAPRPGFNFGQHGRVNDIVGGGAGPSLKYQPRRWTEGDREYYDDAWGNVWVRMVGGSVKGEIHTPLLDDWSKLDSLPGPDYDDPARWRGAREVFAAEAEKFHLASMGGWVFNDARYLRRLDRYLMDMIEFPNELRRLHEIVADVYEGAIRCAAEAGADGICFAEDMGTQTGLLFSPAMWREYFGELYARLFGLTHELGMKVFMHSCGYNWEILPDLLEAGVDVFQFDQPAVYDMPALAELLAKNKAALWSPVDIQKVLPTGDRAFIEAETRHMIDVFRGGLILKSYPDLPGIGVAEEWDRWAYDEMVRHCGLQAGRGARG